jgi:hypothetical protein
LNFDKLKSLRTQRMIYSLFSIWYLIFRYITTIFQRRKSVVYEKIPHFFVIFYFKIFIGRF